MASCIPFKLKIFHSDGNLTLTAYACKSKPFSLMSNVWGLWVIVAEVSLHVINLDLLVFVNWRPDVGLNKIVLSGGLHSLVKYDTVLVRTFDN